jgi:hypothetical protein
VKFLKNRIVISSESIGNTFLPGRTDKLNGHGTEMAVSLKPPFPWLPYFESPDNAPDPSSKKEPLSKVTSLRQMVELEEVPV